MKGFKTGVPLIVLIVGGSYFLSKFTETHVELKDKQNKSTSVRKFDLEQEHREMMSKLDIDNYVLSRVPRPGEDTKTMNKKDEK